ncbi:MAG: F0F1 ATP synthase subunit A [Coriobacteriales bacterium]|nr:F0F1 ATP synthase subunit A [Coriobacteriales bacterium]
MENFVEEMTFEHFPAEINHLLEFLGTTAVFHIGPWEVSNYLFFLFIGIILFFALMLYARRRAALVPEGRLYNAVEALVELVRNDLVIENIGSEGKKYFPFIGTVFFFVLINNFIGLIPGAKPGTGTMGVTVALALFAFVFFNAAGMRKKGVGGYITGVVPHGVPGILWPVIWVIEVISLLIRPFTLSIRLFANMYAGHIVLGIFSILTSIGVAQAIHGLSGAGAAAIAVGGIQIIAWITLLTALYVLEIVVALLQAYIFTLLTTVYVSLAVSEH